MTELTIQLPDELFNKLKIQAEHQKISINELIIKVIEAYLDKAE